MKGDNLPKTSRGDNRGMAVVVLDALTRYRREPLREFRLLNLLLNQQQDKRGDD